MSIQFRTRSQTVVDYSQYITNNNITGCCYVYDSNTNLVSKTENTTVSSCNQQNGHFIAGECDANTNITPSSTGCCCACSLNSPTVTTLCECESLSGRWTLGSTCAESEETLCISGTLENTNRLDHREPRACCYPEYNDDGTVYANCVDVCSEKECAEKAVYPYTATFYNNGRKCNEQVGSAGPAADECKLSETNNRVLNSCENGTNVFCWNVSYMSTCDNKTWFDNKFAGRFAQGVNQGVFQIRIKDVPQFYNLILSPKYAATYTDPVYAETDITSVTKFCPGGYVEGRENPTDGYFAIIDGQARPVYYATEYFKNLYTQTPLNSPIPLSISPNLRVLDLIATRHFSAYIDTNNTVKIYGRFYNSKDNQFKTLTVNTKLKKLYQHNVYEYNTETTSTSITSFGFVGQKLDNSFDYYSPFINDIPELKDLRTMIRSLPHKEFLKASFGSNTFCGIDADGIMTCNSLNADLNYPLNKKYRLVSCSSDGGFEGNTNPNFDYCFAIDENNRIIKIGKPNTVFENQPLVSYTDVIDLSCYSSACFAVVEPDENICNNQMNGSCCTCDVDISNCIQTNKGNCTRLNGKFKTGGLCCNTDNPTEGCIDCNTVVGGNCGSSSFVPKTIQTQTTLPESELTYYEDGLYVGIFEPGVPINTQGSVVNGNPYTGSAVEYIPNVVGYGTTAKRWAIIVDTNDYDLGTINDTSEPTEVIPASMYDGLWNTYGDNQTYYGIQSKTMETLRENSKLSGWYLPSKNELEFINSKLNHGFFIPEAFKSMNSGIYLTSTPYFERQSVTTYNLDSQIFKGQSFMFGQSYSKSDYGSIYLVPRTSKVNVRRIRRIELE